MKFKPGDIIRYASHILRVAQSTKRGYVLEELTNKGFVNLGWSPKHNISNCDIIPMDELEQLKAELL